MTMLNEAQERSLTITLRLLERTLADQERLLVDPSPPLVLTNRVRDVDEAAAARLFSLSADAQREIHEIMAAYGLRPARESTRRILATALSVVWADLEDTRPKKLRGYGEVSPELIESLGPRIGQLIELVQAMQQLLDAAQ